MPDSRGKGVLLLLVLSLLVGGVVSYFASEQPDGLNSALSSGKESSGASGVATPHAAPFPDYTTPGVESRFLSKFIAGVSGVTITFAVLWGVGFLLARGGRKGSGRAS